MMRSLQRHQRRQRGFSLVELMIAMAIGLVVMGAVFAGYVAATQSSRHSRAIAQMAEDATSALAVLRANTAMAGFSRPLGVRSVNGRQMFRPLLAEPYVAGCNGGVFTDTAAAMPDLACPASNDTSPDAVAVTYEANAGNSAMGGTPAAPLDCLGNQVAHVDALAPNPAYDLAYSRFYLDGTDLKCHGNPANGAQTLAENVQDMQIQYGVQTGVKQRVAYYTDAANVPDWNRVAAMRICLVMRSEHEVLDAKTDYTGCFPAQYGDQVTPDDRRAYRAFTTTIVLNSRLPPDPPVPTVAPTP